MMPTFFVDEKSIISKFIDGDYILVDIQKESCPSSINSTIVKEITFKYPTYKEKIKGLSTYSSNDLFTEIQMIFGSLNIIFINYQDTLIEGKRYINDLVRIGTKYSWEKEGVLLFHISSKLERKFYRREDWSTFCDNEKILFGHEIQEKYVNSSGIYTFDIKRKEFYDYLREIPHEFRMIENIFWDSSKKHENYISFIASDNVIITVPAEEKNKNDDDFSIEFISNEYNTNLELEEISFEIYRDDIISIGYKSDLDVIKKKLNSDEKFIVLDLLEKTVKII